MLLRLKPWVPTTNDLNYAVEGLSAITSAPSPTRLGRFCGNYLGLLKLCSLSWLVLEQVQIPQ